MEAIARDAIAMEPSSTEGPAMWVRQAVVAGRFYPEDAGELRAYVRDAIHRPEVSRRSIPKALIVPHAGYVYSGAVAAAGYASIEPWADRIDRVILLGTCHTSGVDGLAATSARAFQTPLGTVEVDVAAVAEALRSPAVGIHDDAHRNDHSLEVQLPFLQVILGDFRIVPLLIGRADPVAVAEVLETFWNGDSNLIVVSSDLSHYHSDQEAQRRDRATARAIEALDDECLEPDSACGRNAIAGLLRAARTHGLSCRAVAIRNSGEASGQIDRVVGYGAFVLFQGRDLG